MPCFITSTTDSSPWVNGVGSGTSYAAPMVAGAAALLMEMSFCANDSVKFAAIDACGAFLPVGEISYFAGRAARRTEDCLNPNVVLCRCAGAVGKAAARLPKKSEDSDRRAVLGVLPFLVSILARKGRNRGA